MMGSDSDHLETLSLSDSTTTTFTSFLSSSSSSFIDPPSYHDVTFSPSPDPNPRPHHHHHPLPSISVSDPRSEPGPPSFISYLITSSDPSSHLSFRVRRRFRDFVTLADRLAESHRGLFIPPRPDKNALDSQMMHKNEFVERRRVELEKYLLKLAAHPVIGKSEELRLFLRAEGKLPLAATTDVASRMLDGAVRLPRQVLMGEGAVVDREEAVREAKGGRDLLRIFKELKQSVTNEWGGRSRVGEVVEEDRGFLERKEMVQEWEQQIMAASVQAEALVKAQHDIGETMGGLGMALIKLVKLENDEALYNSQRIRASDAKFIATAAVKASRCYRELNAQTVKHLDTLHEYLGLMLAVRSAFSDRSNALLTVQTLSSDLSTLHSRVEKLDASYSKIFGGDESRIRKLEEIKKTIRATEDAKSCAMGEYERIKVVRVALTKEMEENNKYELDRLDKERHDDFLGMLKGFVTNQVGYAEKIASVWETAAKETHQYAKAD